MVDPFHEPSVRESGGFLEHALEGLMVTLLDGGLNGDSQGRISADFHGRNLYLKDSERQSTGSTIPIEAVILRALSPER